ncbi:hypothetical protein CTI12_AA388080 [Artemisia annua]|uniref:Uncharacterized protein n=1 Tax=Artemisia annua TaxID=35608 RepID=A0A2U1MC11_ARTAN|nr:hypothetical protein CTI12_AA388080 [Artemisia annua]
MVNIETRRTRGVDGVEVVDGGPYETLNHSSKSLRVKREVTEVQMSTERVCLIQPVRGILDIWKTNSRDSLAVRAAS